MKRDEVELLGELSVVTLLCFFDALKVRLQMLRVGKRRPVDALQHRVALVTTPVGASNVRELERTQKARGWNVRPLAQVDPLPVLVDGELALKPREVFELVGLSEFLEDPFELFPGDHSPLKRRVFFDDFQHLRFDGREVIVAEGPAGIVVVVVEPVVRGRAEGDLGARKKTLHGVRHHVRRGVANDGQRQRVPGLDGDDFVVCAERNWRVKIKNLVTDRQGNHSLAE